MPGKKGGGKNKRRGKKGGGGLEKRELEFKDEGQEYAQVVKMLGNGRLEATCADGKTRLCHIRGAFRKRVWINAGDVILLGMREFEDDKADVIHKYTPEEARTLKAYEEIPSSWLAGGDADAEEDDGTGVAFGGDLPSQSSEDDDPLDPNATVQDLLEAL